MRRKFSDKDLNFGQKLLGPDWPKFHIFCVANFTLNIEWLPYNPIDI